MTYWLMLVRMDWEDVHYAKANYPNTLANTAVFLALSEKPRPLGRGGCQWCNTANDVEIETATRFPEIVFKSSSMFGKGFKPQAPKNN